MYPCKHMSGDCPSCSASVSCCNSALHTCPRLAMHAAVRAAGLPFPLFATVLNSGTHNSGTHSRVKAAGWDLQVHPLDDRGPHQGATDQAAGVVHAWGRGSGQDHAHGPAGPLCPLCLPGLYPPPPFSPPSTWLHPSGCSLSMARAGIHVLHAAGLPCKHVCFTFCQAYHGALHLPL